jgi:FAD/FMN-containing dehydrogenase
VAPLTRREFVAAAGAAVLMPGAAAAEAARSPALRELARAVRGPLFVRGARGYAAVAHGYNERYDGRFPRAVLVARGTGDVQAAVRWAARHRVPVAARSGGHSYAGFSTPAGGLVIDLRRLHGIEFERQRTRAVIGPGARLGDVYARLAARGVTVPAGSCPTVGLGGLALGGGMGLAGRAYGLTCDRIVALRIVTADGRVRSASATEEPDLFWACRGGGGGNFGVVTALTLRTAPAPRAAAFSIAWPWSQAGEAIAAWQELMGGAPHGLTSVLSLSSGRRVAAIGQFLGAETRMRDLVRPLAAVAGARLSTSTSSYLDLQRRWGGSGGSARARFAAGSDFVRRPLSRRGREAAIAAIERRGGASGALLLDSYGGAINRVRPEDTAFVHRDALFSIQYLAYGPTGAGARWVRAARAALAPHVTGAAYQNYIDPDRSGWARAYYGANLERLRAIKATVDPDRVFDFAQAV